MDVKILFLLFLLVSCMPEAQVGRSNLASTPGTTSGNNGGGTSTAVAPSVTSWNYLGVNSQNITINASNLNNAFLVGTSIENYLSDTVNFNNADYCVVTNYSLGGISYQLRSRVVPISYYDFSARRTVRVFRVDFNDQTNSMAICNAPLMVPDPNNNYAIDQNSPLPVFDPAALCSNCTSTLTSTSVRLFKKEISLMQVPTNLIPLNSLALLVDPNNATNTNIGICTNSNCVSRGFSCCLDNQCVQEATIRPSASTLYSSELAVAKEEVRINPLAYRNYPHLYYVCGTSVSATTTSGSSGGGTSAGYDEAFEQIKKDYKCLEHIKQQSTVSPFHNEILFRATPYNPATDCLTASSQLLEHQHIQNVMKRLFKTCGCSKNDLSEMIASCPAYEYSVTLRDTFNEPTRIDCYTPPSTVIPATQQSVTVNSRSAPHRFFDANGVERNITNSLTTHTQEGDSFSYLDDEKVLPLQQNFSMNAILGQMSVSLDKALPAKEVSVELDQVYFLSTTSGFYTPCPTCARDSWLSAFSAHPMSGFGVGLQAIGHTTERDALGTNSTGGNYEDTIFGRACWIPPTMIPFSHFPTSSAIDQRRNRLRTQAALFANGYQRDWYGFNKGALIGSFDGVSWFAIGKGRIVRSTSKKLLLAINAPFADLASPTLHVVSIQQYDGITQAAQVDYDPQYHLSHPYQNEAGNCQANHFCSTDTDCITRLGWEYACADVREVKTNWPLFDVDAKEIPDDRVVATIDQILLQKRFPSSNTRRCVYRGSGAPCMINTSNLSDLNKRKILTCAPNFYCANLSSGQFNGKVARFGAPLEDIPVSRNHFFGKDANILGRPLDYIPSLNASSLPTEVRTAISRSLEQTESTAGPNAGLCQPGKALPTVTNQTTLFNPYTQHLSADGSRRADYISQIGSCNSGLFTEYRYSSCPVIGTDGNYEMFATSSLQTLYQIRARNQNACGLDSLAPSASLTSSPDTLQQFSPFRNIEAKPLSSQVILGPTLVRDACLRRAGQVCHTDLDCGPNVKHADQVDYFSLSFFGNEAERSYHREYLVCGQTDPKPLPSSTTEFRAYQMNQNRCCREAGKDLTTYTRDVPRSSANGDYEPITANLNASIAPGIAPNSQLRYSRYATVEGLGTTSRPIVTANHDRSSNHLPAATNNVLNPGQWKTLGEANSETCCGGGWVRKFSDGTNDWSKRDRVFLDVQNFRCLNSRTVLLTTPEDVVPAYSSPYASAEALRGLVSQDYNFYCSQATCPQYTFSNGLSDTAPALEDDTYATSYTVNTVNPLFTAANRDFYFMPRTGDSHPDVFFTFSNSPPANARRNIILRVPSYVRSGLSTIDLVAQDGTTLPNTCLDVTSMPDVQTHTDLASASCPFTGTQGCCFSYDNTTRILKVVLRPMVYPAFENKRIGVRFTIATAGSGVSLPDSQGSLTRSRPATSTYYLRRLGQLELSGIPQILHEALYCSDNTKRLIPGIFNPLLKTKRDFEGDNPLIPASLHGFTPDPNPPLLASLPRRPFYNTFKALENEPVFSASEFKCCTPLGKTTDASTKCCSGFGLSQGTSNTRFTCALPAGVNLSVYFNRFVTNEGRGTDQPGGGLVDADFNDRTGEPLIQASVNDKLRALGNAYCATGRTRTGGAFGEYEPEPVGPLTDLSQRIFGIVDSSRDIGTSSNAATTAATGYNAFMDGFRWNHHLYCAD
jgi:hypothetical protein